MVTSLVTFKAPSLSKQIPFFLPGGPGALTPAALILVQPGWMLVGKLEAALRKLALGGGVVL